MNKTGKASFTTKTWDEKTTSEITGGRKLTTVQATFAYTGDIEGESTLNYLMAYAPDGTGSFTGLENIVGRIGDRAGSFVVLHTGTFDPHSVTTHLDFVPGLGTEGLEGLAGSGDVKLAGEGPYIIAFEYDL